MCVMLKHCLYVYIILGTKCLSGEKALRSSCSCSWLLLDSERAHNSPLPPAAISHLLIWIPNLHTTHPPLPHTNPL